jgi:hypothetical protein
LADARVVDITKPTEAIVTAPLDGIVILSVDCPRHAGGQPLDVRPRHGSKQRFPASLPHRREVGDEVRKANRSGAVGMIGRANGPHLHWRVRTHDAKLIANHYRRNA